MLFHVTNSQIFMHIYNLKFATVRITFPSLLSSFHPLTQLIYIQVKIENYFTSRLSAQKHLDTVSILLGTSSGYPKCAKETQVVTKCPAENPRHFLQLLSTLASLLI